MIEGGIGPRNHVVAGFAGLRETRGDVIGNATAQSLCAVPVSGVAGIASSAGEVVIVAGVALIAVSDLASGRHLVAGG